MAKIIRQTYFRIVLTFLFCVSGLLSFAQDKGLDVDINVNKEKDWYQQPWAWVIGGAIFILLLVALLRGSSAKRE